MANLFFLLAWIWRWPHKHFLLSILLNKTVGILCFCFLDIVFETVPVCASMPGCSTFVGGLIQGGTVVMEVGACGCLRKMPPHPKRKHNLDKRALLLRGGGACTLPKLSRESRFIEICHLLVIEIWMTRVTRFTSLRLVGP